MPETGKRTGFGPGTMFPVGFLLVYLFFPVVFVLPIKAIYGRTAPPAVERCLEVFFWPLDCLDRCAPTYHALIEVESCLLD